MKTLFTLFLFLTAINTNAQNSEKEEYLIARTVEKGTGAKPYYVLYLDNSKAKAKDYTDPTDAVDDSLGHTVKFKLESSALNYLADQSWTIVSVIPIFSQGSFTETKYIFRRKVTSESLPIAKPTAE